LVTGPEKAIDDQQRYQPNNDNYQTEYRSSGSGAGKATNANQHSTSDKTQIEHCRQSQQGNNEPAFSSINEISHNITIANQFFSNPNARQRAGS
jgi:hypothetical protein